MTSEDKIVIPIVETTYIPALCCRSSTRKVVGGLLCIYYLDMLGFTYEIGKNFVLWGYIFSAYKDRSSHSMAPIIFFLIALNLVCRAKSLNKPNCDVKFAFFIINDAKFWVWARFAYIFIQVGWAIWNLVWIIIILGWTKVGTKMVSDLKDDYYKQIG